MREIKFRAYDKYKKEMYIVSKMDWNIFSEEIEIISTGHKDNSCLAYNRNHNSEKCDIGALEIMQYTGLKDKNGKEIYEGDIIQYEDITKGLVRYSEKYAQYVLVDTGSVKDEFEPLGYYNMEVFEIIGNEFDNPNLLEKEDE